MDLNHFSDMEMPDGHVCQVKGIRLICLLISERSIELQNVCYIP